MTAEHFFDDLLKGAVVCTPGCGIAVYKNGENLVEVVFVVFADVFAGLVEEGESVEITVVMGRDIVINAVVPGVALARRQCGERQKGGEEQV